MADATNFVPWLLTLMLAGICWKQQQTIHTYEQEASPNIQNPFHVPSDDQTKDSTTVGETKTVDGSSDVFPVEKSHIQERPAIVQPSAEKALTNDEIEDMIEHRALERLEEIEDERRQKRVEQLSEHMHNLVDEWAEDFGWSEDTQSTMMDIMTDYVYGRVEVHVMLKNGSIERDGIRPYFQQIATERNEAIIELIGEDDFSEIEDKLHPKGGPR